VKWTASFFVRDAKMRVPEYTDSWLTGPEPASRDAACLADESGVYLTDDVFLYRVVGFVVGPVETVELEDCYRLDVVRVSLADVRMRRLRVVAPHQG